MDRINLKPKEERRLLKGHCWVYRNELASVPELEDGVLVEVVSSYGKPVGTGFYQAAGGIAVRLLDAGRIASVEEFVALRIGRARELRERIYGESRVYRWVFGESDGLPGLVADRYDSVVALQTQCGFYERVADTLAETFLRTEGVEGVSLSGPSGVRRWGELRSRVACEVEGVQFVVDLAQGQKTGMFLDQRDNWALLQPWCAGAEVLDGCCYTGAWSLQAARYGAKRTVGVDTSAPALEMARELARLNGAEDVCAFEVGPIEDTLREERRYDVTVLDPPALAKARGHVTKALGRYQALNRDAIRSVREGGLLITCSCSHFVSAEQFLESVRRAAIVAKRRARLIEFRGAARDHPVLLTMHETAYLKCAAVQID